MKVSCLGPKESYSVLAAEKLCPNSQKVYCISFEEALNLLTDGKVDAAVLPVENCLMGNVVQNLDLISSKENIIGVGECILHINHHLVTKGNIPYSQITRICSHMQALSQCATFIGQHFPHARLVSAHSTAESLSMLDDHTAGIVGGHVTGEGLVLSEENIADSERNYTRFLMFQRGNAPAEKSDYIYFSAVCKHEPGTLYRLLGIFEESGLNLTQIESRPIRNAIGQYRFFIEFAGDIGSETVKKALAEAKEACQQFRLLGAY